MESIGIGITTRNRPEVLAFVVKQFDKYCPNEIKIVVVDDNSDDQDENRRSAEQVGDYYYSEERLGVAKAKNKCIELLDADHVFLFDDDCFPIEYEWYRAWIDAGIAHMSYACEFNKETKKRQITIREAKDNVIWWNGTFGCCLYFSRMVFDRVGVFDERFKIWGYEHPEYTARIYKSGIIPYPYICPAHSGVWSFDAEGSYGEFTWRNISSMTKEEKAIASKANATVYQQIIAELNASSNSK